MCRWTPACGSSKQARQRPNLLRAARETLARGAGDLDRAKIGSIAIDVDAAPREVGLSYAILNRHLFMNRPDLSLPTWLLLDPDTNVVKVYRDHVDLAD